MLTRKSAIRVALETTAGTDPASGFSTLLAWDIEPDIKGEVLKRDMLRNTLSNVGHVVGIQESAVNFKTELKSGGGSGTVPEMDLLLQSVGFGTAAHSGTEDIVYSLKSDEADLKTLSLYIYKDGNKHKVTGARGNLRFVMEAGKYGICEWEFRGKYNAVVAETAPTAAAGVTPPVMYNSSFQIAGFSPVSSRAQIDLQNNISRRDDLNATAGVDSFRLTTREPKFEFDADAVVESSNPFWGDWSGAVVDTFAIQAGTNDGSIVKLTGYFQYDSAKYADKEGVSVYECVATLVSSDASTSNDELTVTFT
jgi:hypothetical protein